MKKILLIATMLFVVSMSAYAQDEFPKFELAGTYSLLSADIDILANETLHGWGVSGQYNVKSYFGIVGEYTADHGASGPVKYVSGGVTYNIPELDTRVQYLLFGPRFSYRHKYVTVFGHWLIGSGHNKLNDEKGVLSGALKGETATNWTFAMAIGGGLDINMGKHFSLRPAQFDWLPTGSGDLTLQGSSSRFNNIRYQLGGVVKF
jgi:opacity protein-like surface antigen